MVARETSSEDLMLTNNGLVGYSESHLVVRRMGSNEGRPVWGLIWYCTAECKNALYFRKCFQHDRLLEIELEVNIMF